MAFRRFFRKRLFRKRIFRKRRSGRTSLASKAYRIARRVDTRAERKYFNTAYGSTLATSFNVWCPIEIAQGDTALTRDGNQIDHRYTTLRMAYEANAGSNVTPCHLRVVVVQMINQYVNAPILGADVFLDPTAWNSVYNFPARTGFFRVIKDKTFNLAPNTLGYPSAGATADSVNRLVSWKWKIKLPKRRILWTSTAGTDFLKNQFYVLHAVSNGSYTVTPDCRAQTCFIDS